MIKKEYLAPQISVIMIEPQAILAGSGLTSSGIKPESDITEGSENDWED